MQIASPMNASNTVVSFDASKITASNITASYITASYITIIRIDSRAAGGHNVDHPRQFTAGDNLRGVLFGNLGD